MLKPIAKGGIAAALVTGLLVSSYGCEQPKPKCAAGRGAFIGVYKKVSGPDSCNDLKGEKLGFGTYNPEGKEGKPNLNVASIAIQSESLGSRFSSAATAGATDPDASHKPFGLGEFTTSEPEGDFCVVPTLSVALQNLPEIKADAAKKIKAQPATSVSYAWSNVRLYVTAVSLGTQFTADLTLTTDGVACGYSVVGMYPYVDCSKENPAGEKEPPLADETACDPEANEDAGRPTGSGINPDFPTKCDPDLLACVLTKDVLPALK